jgi:hypothetical protein
MSRPCLVLAILALCTPGVGLGQGASGVFDLPEAMLPITDAYAFRTTSVADSSQPVVAVAVSNGRFSEAIDRYLDRRYVIENYVRGGETGVVIFEFLPDGEYWGVSYFAGPGLACAFCRDEGVQAEVEVTEDRIVGKIAYESDERSFDVTLDARIAPDDHGERLPADGGEPGAVYRRLGEALQARDEAALREIFSQGLLDGWTQAREAGEGDRFLQMWIDDRPRDWRLVEGWVKDDVAVLLVRGKQEAMEVEAEVVLLRPEDEWKVNDEIVRPIVEP